MKNLALLIFTLLTINLITLSQSCLPLGIEFETQLDIDNFQNNYPNCTEIEGNVEINGDSILNLEGLSVLTAIGGELLIKYNPNLSSLVGLEGLTHVGNDLFIYGSLSLISLTGLANVTSIGGSLKIVGNPALTSLTGLENLTSIEGIMWIRENSSLTSLSGLDNVSYVGGSVEIYGNNSLTSFSGLESLTSIGGELSIMDNDVLINLTGLENLTSIEEGLSIGTINIQGSFGNPSLTSLNGLDSLLTIGGNFEIQDNNALTSFSALENVTSIGGSLIFTSNNVLTSLTGLDNVTSINGSLRIFGNPILTNLTGLENVTSIGGNLDIANNDVLTSIAELGIVTSIGGYLYIQFNNALTSLAGLDNIDAGSIDHLHISYNASLSTCEVLSICNFLSVSPNSIIEIHDNAPGCNSQEEVKEACEAVQIKELYHENSFDIFPNPCNSSTTIKLIISKSELVRLFIMDFAGKEIQKLVSKQFQAGSYQFKWNAKRLPAGIYFLRLEINGTTETRKLLLIN